MSFWYFALFAALLFLTGTGQALARLCLLLCGALAGYLLFNTYRASVFMGDTGSLGLGGFAASVAALSGNLLYILIFGVMFVCSGISVITQVIYYKRTKKRLFLMAPLLACKKVPYIVARGRKGGSSVAAAIVNALVYSVRR